MAIGGNINLELACLKQRKLILSLRLDRNIHYLPSLKIYTDKVWKIKQEFIVWEPNFDEWKRYQIWKNTHDEESIATDPWPEIIKNWPMVYYLTEKSVIPLENVEVQILALFLFCDQKVPEIKSAAVKHYDHFWSKAAERIQILENLINEDREHLEEVQARIDELCNLT